MGRKRDTVEKKDIKEEGIHGGSLQHTRDLRDESKKMEGEEIKQPNIKTNMKFIS